MFGYIKIYKNELKYKHLITYKQFYCILCSSLGKNYGHMYRLFDSYDVTFFLILFDCLSRDKQIFKVDCPLSKRKNVEVLVSAKAVDYCSFINIFWLMQKIKDDKIDNNFNKHFLLNNIIKNNKKIKNAIEANELNVNRWIEILNEYYYMENDLSVNFDDLCNCIGRAYGEVFRNYADFIENTVYSDELYQIGFNIGKYIYIIDAFDDYFSDKKNNNFNPILKMKEYTDDISNNYIALKIQMMIGLIVNKLKELLSKIELTQEENYCIIENIIHFGLLSKVNEIAIKKYYC